MLMRLLLPCLYIQWSFPQEDNMPVAIDDHTRDRTVDLIGSTPSTWPEQGTFCNVKYGDRGTWMLACQAQVNLIITEMHHMSATSRSGWGASQMKSVTAPVKCTSADELLITLSEELPAGVCVIQDGKFCYVNSSFPIAIGYKLDQLEICCF